MNKDAKHIYKPHMMWKPWPKQRRNQILACISDVGIYLKYSIRDDKRVKFGRILQIIEQAKQQICETCQI